MVSKTVVKRISLGLFASFAMVATVAEAQLLYCCKDEKGSRTCGDSLPRACYGKPHTITGRGGRLLKRVDGPLSPEQIKAKKALADQKKADAIQEKAQARLDQALLATYANEAEIDKARERAENEILESIKPIEAKLEKLEQLRKKTADNSEHDKRALAGIDTDIKTQKGLIEGKKKDLESVRNKYSDEKRRYMDIQERRTIRR